MSVFVCEQECVCVGGTVAQTVAPTTFWLDARGLMSFLLSTPHLFSLSFPASHFHSSLSTINKRQKKPQKKKKKKKKECVCVCTCECVNMTVCEYECVFVWT